MIVLALLIGAAFGAAVVFGLSQKSNQARTVELQVLKKDVEGKAEALAKAEAELVHVRERAEVEREQLIKNLDAAFEQTSQRVLDRTVSRFGEQQEQVAGERDKRLKDNLEPIKDILGKYEASLKNFDEAHRDALEQVREKADRLLQTQIENQQATTKLNQILGRSDSRGRWGEVQLANVLQASNLTEGLDFILQASNTSAAGDRQRPDCVINLPNEGHIVVDAKFPFDKFEQSLSVTDIEEARRLRGEHAQALRQHVVALAGKSYFEKMAFTPKFTVCFVPSDAALTAAYDADPLLFEYANQKGILIAGPTNLLALLWSAAMVLREYRQTLNTEKILHEAARLPDLLRNVAAPLVKMGDHLDKARKSYNDLVGSVESRLLPVSRTLQHLGVGTNAKVADDLKELSEPLRQLDVAKWDVDPSDDDVVQRSEIIDIDEYEEFENVDADDNV